MENNKLILFIKYLQISLYSLKVITYGAMAIMTYSQIQLKGLNAPEDILELVDGPLGRIIIGAAILIHNLIGLAKRIYPKSL